MNKDIHLKRQLGVSLIELMIAAAIGVTLILLSFDFLIQNTNNKRVNAAFSIMKDNGTIALTTMARYLRPAGIHQMGAIPPIYGDSTILGGLCDNRNDFCTRDNSNDSDRIAIYKQYPHEYTSCNGVALERNVPIIEVFYLETIQDVSTLVCRSFDITTQQWFSEPLRVIQTGIESMQIQYFERNVMSAVDADNVTSWYNIEGVDIAVLASSQQSAFTENQTKDFQLLTGDSITFSDRMARQVFQLSIVFNNKSLGGGS